MGDYKLSCPHCGQHIQCDEQWSGRQVSCPSCSGTLVIPQLARTGPRPAKKDPKSPAKIIVWSLVAVVLIGGFAYAFKAVNKIDAGLAKKADQVAANSGGGELTHIAKLYQVLDATDPAKMEKQQMDARAAMERAEAKMQAENAVKPDPSLALPLAAPDWTLNAATAAISKARVNGNSGGESFHIDNVKLERGATTAVLTFAEGVGTSADHELILYLPAAAQDNLAGRSWNVTKDSTSRQAMQIIRKWTVDPRYAPVQKAFPKGYVLKLEFDEPTRDWQPGRIYLALPDTNKTVLAGEFSISIPRPPEKFMIPRE